MADQTKEQIAAERDQLRRELDTAKAENAQLRQAANGAGRPANPEPRFELSEGERTDLQLNGATRSIRTGETIVASDYPGDVDPELMSDTAKRNEQAAVRDRELRASGATIRDGLPRDVPVDRGTYPPVPGQA